MDSKSVWQSRTLWLNGLSFVAAMLVYVLAQPWVQANPDLATALAAALALANAAMRFLTTMPLAREVTASPAMH